MDQEARRSLHQVVMRALDKDAAAPALIEEAIFKLERSGSADDVVQALEMLTMFGLRDLHARIVAQLREDAHLAASVFGVLPS